MGLLLKKQHLETLFTFEYANIHTAPSKMSWESKINAVSLSQLSKKIEYYLAYLSLIQPGLEKYILVKDSDYINQENIIKKYNVLWEYSGSTATQGKNDTFVLSAQTLVLLFNSDPTILVDLADELFCPSQANISVFAINPHRIDLLHYKLSSSTPFCLRDFLQDGEVFMNVNLGNHNSFFNSITIKTKSDLVPKIKGYNQLICKRGIHLTE